jgi:glycosyltransferase involved in cell wall biosynthesis
MKISVVAGTARLHLFGTISELHRMDSLGTAYVPFGLNLSQKNPMRRINLMNRVASRYPELTSVPKVQVIAPEFFYQVGLWLSVHKFYSFGDLMTAVSFRLYSLLVNLRLKRDDADVIIIRCGFGKHIDAGDKLRVCDLSMAHPYVDLSLTSGKGFALESHKKLNRVAKLMVADLSIADRVIVNSDFVRESCVLAGLDPSKITVAYLPPSHELLAQEELNRNGTINDDRAQVVLFVGTLSHRKGIDLVLKVAQACIERKLDFQFVLIGNWSDVSSRVKKEFRNLENIEFIPWLPREELVAFYSKANFLLCPTRADGGARVITEAMLFGVAVLTTTVSGSPITSGTDGFEFELLPEDSFVENVIKVLQNSKIAREIGFHANRTVLEKLTMINYMEKVLNCCEV